jgi:hypothetical protein
MAAVQNVGDGMDQKQEKLEGKEFATPSLRLHALTNILAQIKSVDMACLFKVLFKCAAH